MIPCIQMYEHKDLRDSNGQSWYNKDKTIHIRLESDEQEIKLHTKKGTYILKRYDKYHELARYYGNDDMIGEDTSFVAGSCNGKWVKFWIDKCVLCY